MTESLEELAKNLSSTFQEHFKPHHKSHAAFNPSRYLSERSVKESDSFLDTIGMGLFEDMKITFTQFGDELQLKQEDTNTNTGTKHSASANGIDISIKQKQTQGRKLDNMTTDGPPTKKRKISHEASMTSLDELMEFNQLFKRSERINGVSSPSVHESLPNKKHKKHKKKKKKYNGHKWKSFKGDLLFGEAEVPLRMCWHGTIMQPEPNPLSDPRVCHCCEETIYWDQYYHCDCDGVRTDYCWHHTRKLCFPSPRGWKQVDDCVKRCNKTQRKAMMENLAIPQRYIKKYKKNRKNKNNRVGVVRHKRKSDNDDDVVILNTKPAKDKCSVPPLNVPPEPSKT
eukprot:862491_1